MKKNYEKPIIELFDGLMVDVMATSGEVFDTWVIEDGDLIY